MTLLARCQTCPHRSIDRCGKSNRHIKVMDARGEPCPLDLPPKADSGKRKAGNAISQSDPRSPKPAPPIPVCDVEPRTIERVAIVTCYFNPMRYSRIRRNYDRFREGMHRAGIDPYVIELAFDDDPFELENSTLRVRGNRNDHLLWQKERLLSLLIERVPDLYDAIGWFDCDILFQNDAWLDGVRDVLATHTICQPFCGSWFTETSGELTCLKRSMGWFRQHDPANFLDFGKAHPGFAWVARADWLRRHKLLDECITGGGDSLMVKACSDERPLFIDRWLNPAWLDSVNRWAAEARADGGQALGFVPGDVVHLYHGKRSNRLYRERWEYLTDHNYQPAVDVETDPANGLLRWTDAARECKPEMIAKVAGYFAERKEDD